MEKEFDELTNYALLQQQLLATKESREYFKTVFNSLVDAIFIHDSRSYNIVDCNEAATRMYGYKSEEFNKLNIADLSLNDEKYNQQNSRAAFEKAFSEGPHTFEWIAKKKSGELFPTEISARSITIGGVIYLLVTVHDITKIKKNEEKLRENEERLRTLINAMPDIVCFKDGGGRWLEANAFDLKLFQLEGVDYRGKKDSELACHSSFYRDAFLTCEDTDEASWKAGVATRTDETIPLPDGSEKVFDVIKVPTFKHDGGRKGLIVVGRDITERKKAEQALLAAKEEAERLSVVKTQFLSNMSHELRTPLNGIVGFINLLSESRLDETQKDYCGIVSQSAKHLLQIVNDILDISKIENGHIELNRNDMDIFNFMSALMVQFKKETDTKGINFIFEFDAGVNSIVTGDNLRLKQIFMNLLSNAVKFTEKGNVKFGVEKLCETKTDIALKFYVCDTGIGMHEDKLKDIFQIFNQLDMSNTKKYQGTGLGLSIVKKLLNLMNGTIKVKSALNEGTTFEVFLKFDKHGKIESFEKKEFGEKTGKLKALANQKALIVEDNYANAYLCRLMLAKLGIASDIAANGKLAIEKFKTCEYNFILMDIQLPEVNGFEATAAIKKICAERCADTPIIALTAYARQSDRKRCLESGMAAYISKPFTVEELVDALESVLL